MKLVRPVRRPRWDHSGAVRVRRGRSVEGQKRSRTYSFFTHHPHDRPVIHAVYTKSELSRCLFLIEMQPAEGHSLPLKTSVRGVPRWRDRFPQCGIMVSFWGSKTPKIVIPVENHPQKPENRLADDHPLGGWGLLISVQIDVLTIYVHIGKL